MRAAFASFTLSMNRVKAEAVSKGYNRQDAIDHLGEPYFDDATAASEEWDKIFAYGNDGELAKCVDRGAVDDARTHARSMLRIVKTWLLAACVALKEKNLEKIGQDYFSVNGSGSDVVKLEHEIDDLRKRLAFLINFDKDRLSGGMSAATKSELASSLEEAHRRLQQV